MKCRSCGETGISQFYPSKIKYSDNQCKKCCKVYRRNYRETHREQYNAWMNKAWKKYYPEYYQRIKNEVFHHYCNGDIKCAECGSVKNLSIDHIKGNGEKHRLMLGFNSSYQFYLWIRKNNFPMGYRVLCKSCNSRIRNTKGCHSFNTSRMVVHRLRRFGQTRANDLIEQIAPFTSSKRAVSAAIYRLCRNGKIQRVKKGIYST